MPYVLGVDLGTTYTAAAIHRDGRTTTVDLGTRSAAIPSVVFLRDDEEMLTGEAANRRGATEPGRVAREFKRRVGDTTPILLGGSPYSADALMGKLLRWVVDAVTEREGAAPARIGIAHPANWGPYKGELLAQAIARADLDHASTITEPEAAVTHYASLERVPPGAVIAVYDLGGGTFDAAVVRKTEDDVELLGTPEGIERLGGIDFDEAVFSHVAASLGGALEQLDPDDPSAVAAVARLRAECVEAKEALSADTEVSIPVLLPNLSTEVRLTRTELEAMIRPPLADSLTAMRRALRSADVAPEDLHAVLLAGGSSRIPLVAQVVSAELGRPVAVDAHPKHGVAMGAALAAAQHAGLAGPPATPDDEPAPTPAAVAPSAPVVVAAPDPASAPAPEPAAPVVEPAPTAAVAAVAPPVDPVPAPSRFDERAGGDGGSGSGHRTGGGRGDGDGTSRTPLVIAAVVLVAALVAGAIFLLGGDDDPGDEAGASSTLTDDTTDPTGPDDTTTTAPPPVCPPEDTRPCIEISAITAGEGDRYVIEWTAANFTPSMDDVHGHFFWDIYSASQVSSAVPAAEQDPWDLTDQQPFTSEVLVPSARPEGASAICATPADSSHAVLDGSVFHCAALPD